MKIGCVKEIKRHEYRVGCTPASVAAYTAAGHKFYFEAGAGVASGFTDSDYQAAGAVIVENPADIWNDVDMMIKVKEPLESEYQYFREGLILYTYLHLAANEPLVKALTESKVIGVAYETLEENRALPLLKPMSEVAGKLAVQEGAKYLEKPFGGFGILLGGVTGVAKAKVVVLGGGVVGINAAKVAIGFGANVTILDKNLERLEYIDQIFNGTVQTMYSTDYEIHRQCQDADLVIGAVLIAGAATPKLLKKAYLADMKDGAVVVDVAVDQGGCFETTHATYHDEPTYVIDGVTHYCVANMPGAVPHTSTIALTNATLRYGLEIANKGITTAIKESTVIQSAINTFAGEITFAGVAEAMNAQHTAITSLV
ncbi:MULTISPECIES: alanine dehydrogenase [unclassified Enterococcus]|uniref:alanine dehydrogenase n=1 Tax=unclassified Enterococcus TaxID=2608891 RepID=UPI0024772225|nr:MULTISPECIES: alanine dehydrogenase [unclassified Enterococcus]